MFIERQIRYKLHTNCPCIYIYIMLHYHYYYIIETKLVEYIHFFAARDQCKPKTKFNFNWRQMRNRIPFSTRSILLAIVHYYLYIICYYYNINKPCICSYDIFMCECVIIRIIFYKRLSCEKSDKAIQTHLSCAKRDRYAAKLNIWASIYNNKYIQHTYL